MARPKFHIFFVNKALILRDIDTVLEAVIHSVFGCLQRNLDLVLVFLVDNKNLKDLTNVA